MLNSGTTHKETCTHPKIKISGSESFTRWLAPGSELGASWSEGSETNVLLGFRVPTTIGLRKPPAGSPCSQSIPGSLEPLGRGGRGYGQGGSKLKLAHLPPSTLPSLQLTLSSLQPPSSLELTSSLLLALSSLPAHSSSFPLLQLTPSLLQLTPSSLEPPSSLQLAPSSLQPPSSLQLAPLAPAHSSLPACSKLSPASQVVPLAPARSSLPAHSPCSSSLPACSPRSQLTPLAPSSLPSLQLTPLAPVCSQWPCMCWGPHHLWGVRGYGAR